MLYHLLFDFWLLKMYYIYIEGFCFDSKFTSFDSTLFKIVNTSEVWTCKEVMVGYSVKFGLLLINNKKNKLVTVTNKLNILLLNVILNKFYSYSF